MDLTAEEIAGKLRDLGEPSIAEHSKRFFKTGKGEYGEGDRFLGIRVPVIRQMVKRYRRVPMNEIKVLLRSEFHEERLFALLALVAGFGEGNETAKKEIYNLYLGNTCHVNNWDLVDSSAPQIVGAYLEKRDRKPLYEMVRSQSMWERRISIIATFHMIRKDQFHDTLKIAQILKRDREDLIHKAVGWMLREVGKRDIDAEEAYLKRHYQDMPRTMLRYAIERFPESKKRAYLTGKI
ncbi:MAG: DNA alkylation repair protein [Desulfatiglans sp.]|jgi:3-methyladenine DNA glycosylase AlkD|nr:DNA alkylation repair protein [Thermodesulfobacteriota bacterium]MEE4351936.1 DNA alkylation repair protein [Desulfatiglans sp.]